MSGNQNHNLEDDMIISGEGIVLSCCYHNQSIYSKVKYRVCDKTASQAYLGHRCLALEATPHPIVNTLWFPPCLFHAMVPI